MKDEHDVELENHREKSLLKYILVLQRAVRGWYAKRTFQRLKRSVVKVQAIWRAYRARKAYREMTAGYGRLQALWRARRLAFRYVFARKRIIGFQAYIRGYLARTGMRDRIEAIIKIQAFTRGMIARKEGFQIHNVCLTFQIRNMIREDQIKTDIRHLRSSYSC